MAKNYSDYQPLTWRMIATLNKPGLYRLPFLNDDENVEVVYVTPNKPEVRMKCIIVKIDDNTYQDFYYNDCDMVFKPLTVCEEDYEEWLDWQDDTNDTEENREKYRSLNLMGYTWDFNGVGVPCPSKYANCVATYNVGLEY